MTIEELKIKHFKEYLKSIVTIPEKDHYKISIQFAIEVLKELDVTILKLFKNTLEYDLINDEIYDKIQELKQFLDAKV